MDTAGLSALALAQCVVAAPDVVSGDGWGFDYERARDDLVLEWFHATVAGAADLSAAD
jgi:hypothetical protein